MKQLFLTSEVKLVAKSVKERIKTRSGQFKTAYITTPIEKGHENDDLHWHKDNKQSMIDAGFDIFEYTITGKSIDELRTDLKEADVIYVEGGSLTHMLSQSKKTGFDVFLREFVAKGNPYIGTSTGSFIASSDTEAGLSLEDYFIYNFDPVGIGLVDFLIMPHWGTESFKDKYEELPKKYYHTNTPMIVLNDRQYVWVLGDKFEIIAV